MRHLTTLCDLNPADFERIFALTEELKTKFGRGLRESVLAGKVMALLFEKPSLRTRASFEAGMAHLGGSTLVLGDEAGFGSREPIADFSRVLSQYVDVIVIRAKQHETASTLTHHATCPVINGLTDEAHPCQALADLYTLREKFGTLSGRKLAFIGDGNNVARSLAVGCAKMGMQFCVAAPQGYQLSDDFIRQLNDETPDTVVESTNDPAQAVQGAAAVYTDVWASMGQEKERQARRKTFAPFQVNAQLMRQAPKSAVFMHCLPARRGEEVTDEVLDGPQSIVIEQAANRMHVQKGILLFLLT